MAFSPERQRLLNLSRQISEEYSFPVTVRQLYYQLVSRGHVDPGAYEGAGTKIYKQLVDTLAKARRMGMFPMDLIEDRTRSTTRGEVTEYEISEDSALEKLPDLIKHTIPDQFIHADSWMGQPYFVSVMIEKQALVGFFESICEELGVPLYVLRGYTSVSGIWKWLELYKEAEEARERAGFPPFKGAKVLYFGDHDPDGLEIPDAALDAIKDLVWHNNLFHLHTEDFDLDRYHRHARIKEDDREDADYEFDLQVNRLNNTTDDLEDEHRIYNKKIEFIRCGINIDQIKEINAPPFSAKMTSSRFQKYQKKTGLSQAWELDALPPDYTRRLVRAEVNRFFDSKIEMKIQSQVREARRRYILAIPELLEDISADERHSQELE